MDITLRSGQEFNLKWTISISVIFHIIILFFLLSYNLFTKNSSYDSMYKPFIAVQVNLVDGPAVGLSNTNHENIAVREDRQEASSKKQDVVSQKQEVRSKKLETKSKMPEIRSEKIETVKRDEDVSLKSGTIPPLEIKKQVETASQGAEVRNIPEHRQTGIASKESSGTITAKLTTPWTSSITGGIAGIAGPAVDVPDFKYDYYLGLIRNKVDSRWNQPVTYANVKKAVVEFTIQRNGRIDNIRISESSGDSYFDQTALRAVSLSAPFPPLPKGYKENSLRVKYKFIFEKTGKG